MRCLKNFLGLCRAGVTAAFEFRHESWFTDQIFDLLKKHNRALCVAETEERVTPDVVTADFAYYRYPETRIFGGRTQTDGRTLREHLGVGRDVYAYFKHEETPQGAIYAVEVLREVGLGNA